MAPLSFWDRTWQASLVGMGLHRAVTGLHRRIVPLARGSVTAAWSTSLAGLAAATLLFFSPFLSTGQNALLVLLAAGAAGYLWLVRPGSTGVPSDLAVPVLAFLAVGLMAAAFSGFPLLAAKGLAKMGVFFLAYLTFVISLADRRTARAALGSVALAATIVAAYGIYQYVIQVPPLATWEDTRVLDKVTRVYSTLRNPNLLGGYLIPTGFLTLGLFWWEKTGWRWLALPAGMTQLVCLYFTYSRGAWAGMLMGAAGLVAGLCRVYRAELRASPWLRTGLAALLVAGLVGTAAAVQTLPAFKNRLFSVLQGRSDSSNNFRLNVWKADWQIIGDNWLIGIGPGNDVFKKVYPLYMISGYDALAAYNIFLEVWTEMGLLGLVAFLWLWLAHLWACLARAPPPRPERAFLLCCAAALLGTAVFGLVDTVFFRPQVNILFWLTLALIGRTKGGILADNR